MRAQFMRSATEKMNQPNEDLTLPPIDAHRSNIGAESVKLKKKKKHSVAIGAGLKPEKEGMASVGRASSPTGKLAVTQRAKEAGLKVRKLPSMGRNEIGSQQAMRPPKP